MDEKKNLLMKLGIFTHVTHKLEMGKSYAYSPYVREINLWLKHVETAEVVAPSSFPITKGEFLAIESYRHSNFTFTKIPSFNLLNFKGALKASLRIPSTMVVIISAMRRADHLHIRCPGNIGLLACVCQIFFPHKPKTAKYAGNWDPEAKQPWTYKLQKWILSNTFLTRNMTVLVYGNWQDQSKNILPFFTASFTESEIEKTEKDLRLPYKFLFVGNLVPGKQPLFALHLVEALKGKFINAELHVYGDGPLKVNLENEAENKDYIHLHGNQPLDVLKQAYIDSHFLILASKSEGWPKAVAEAMFFGCIPIATAVSCVPWMLGGGSRGVLISEGNVGDKNLVDRGQRTVDSRDVEKNGDSGHPPTFGVRAGRSLPEPLGAGVDIQDDGEKLLDTFQKNRQFECFSKTAEAVSENVSRTGFSETPADRQGRLEVTSGINNEWKDALEATVQKIIELINDPEEMKRMSIEAQEWSQQYTLEKFEAEIKKLLVPNKR